MKALILAAGYATRLYPLTKEFPKPLLKIKNRPIIDYIVDKLNTIDRLNEIIVVTNSKFISVFRGWAKNLRTKKKITLVDDLTKDLHEKRGAVGDMYFAVTKERIDDDLLVIGGDNLFDGALNEFLAFADANKPSPVIGVYDMKHKYKASKYGVIKLNKKDRIIDFKEKPKNPNSTLIAMCLYYFNRKKLGLISEYTKAMAKKCDATGFYIDWLRKKEPVYGFVFGGRWYDIGHLDFYKEAESKFVELQ